ncbi:MAG: HRDC domain protein [bacterium]|nr:HRDC domain protein [bacterium]
MRFRLFTLKFDVRLERFDDNELQDFLKDKELLSAREHFFVKQEIPYLLVCVSYLPGAEDLAPSTKPKQDEWREIISEAQLPHFNSLRDWRNERARSEGVPPYVICSNKQLAAMVVARPDSLAALGKIEGIGEAKIKKYGPKLLELLKPSDAPEQLDDQPELFDDEAAQKDAE